MSKPYRIFGAELSPYSIKVRSYFRYKKIPHEWVVRNVGNMEEFTRLAKLPLVPLVVTPEGEGIQDSTPILEKMEALFPEPPIHPKDPSLAFLSALLEEYGDEWGNKWMFHYRWTYEADQESASVRLAQDNLPGAPEDAIRNMAASLKERMIPRVSFVGSSEVTRDQIEASFRRALGFLEAHLATRTYLFGARPALADFGLYPQLQQCSTDPTPGAIMRESAPGVLAWAERMLDPTDEGGFENWQTLSPTLDPLLEHEVGGLFLPWSTANARALAAGEKEFSIELEGRPFVQGTQKYHARSLAALEARYAAVPDRASLAAILEKTGCLDWLR